MYVAQMSFAMNESADADTASELVNRLLATMRMNGQVWPRITDCYHRQPLSVLCIAT